MFKEAFAKVYPSAPVPKLGVPTCLQRIADVDGWLYGPLVKLGARVTERVSQTHTGLPQLYMLWQVLGAALVLAVLFAIVKR